MIARGSGEAQMFRQTILVGEGLALAIPKLDASHSSSTLATNDAKEGVDVFFGKSEPEYKHR